MLTGRRAFAGETDSKVIVAVLDSEPPPISASQPLTPPAIDRIVERCLAKDPDERWQTARDLPRELSWTGEPRCETRYAPESRDSLAQGRARLGRCLSFVFRLIDAHVRLLRAALIQATPRCRSMGSGWPRAPTSQVVTKSMCRGTIARDRDNKSPSAAGIRRFGDAMAAVVS
jgi:hypothetical protein